MRAWGKRGTLTDEEKNKNVRSQDKMYGGQEGGGGIVTQGDTTRKGKKKGKVTRPGRFVEE